MIASVIPSQKNSCFGSSLIFTKGSTAMEGISGKGKGHLLLGGDLVRRGSGSKDKLPKGHHSGYHQEGSEDAQSQRNLLPFTLSP